MKPVLSVNIISFNQRDLLRRCLNSVMQQKIRVPWEIVVSDALSHDGTFEMAASFLANNRLKAGERCDDGTYVPDIVPVHCDTNQGGALTRTECCGWMKLTAYLHSKGKYFVNIDADDYLRHDDIYQLQLDTLEAHPECSMCMQDVWQLKDGEPIENGRAWPSFGRLKNGQILSVSDIVSEYRALNQCYMIRRHFEDDMQKLYGKYFDDTIITLHHLQYGSVIWINRADYVWVQYSKSISNSIVNDDHTISYGLLPLHHAKMIPSMRCLFLKYGLKDFITLFKYAPHYPHLSDSYRRSLLSNNSFIYRYYISGNHSSWMNMRYNLLYMYVLVLKRFNLGHQYWYDILYKLLD